METFEDLLRAALRDLDVVIACTPAAATAAAAAAAQAPHHVSGDSSSPAASHILLSANLLVKVTAMNLFAICHTSSASLVSSSSPAGGGGGAAGHPADSSPSWAQVSQRSLLVKVHYFSIMHYYYHYNPCICFPLF